MVVVTDWVCVGGGGGWRDRGVGGGGQQTKNPCLSSYCKACLVGLLTTETQREANICIHT